MKTDAEILRLWKHTVANTRCHDPTTDIMDNAAIRLYRMAEKDARVPALANQTCPMCLKTMKEPICRDCHIKIGNLAIKDARADERRKIRKEHRIDCHDCCKEHYDDGYRDGIRQGKEEMIERIQLLIQEKDILEQFKIDLTEEIPNKEYWAINRIMKNAIRVSESASKEGDSK